MKASELRPGKQVKFTFKSRDSADQQREAWTLIHNWVYDHELFDSERYMNCNGPETVCQFISDLAATIAHIADAGKKLIAPLQLREGGVYVMRDGRNVGPLKPYKSLTYDETRWTWDFFYWDSEGVNCGPSASSSFDLIAEVPPPEPEQFKAGDLVVPKDYDTPNFSKWFKRELAAELTAAQQRVAELERLLRGIQQDAKLGDDEYHVSMSLIMAIDDHIGLNAGEQVIVPNYAADNARLRSAIKEAIERSIGRYDEWGERAQMCFEILQAAIGE